MSEGKGAWREKLRKYLDEVVPDPTKHSWVKNNRRTTKQEKNHD